jgi:endonuclease G
LFLKCSKQRDIVICLGRQAFLAGVLCLSRIAALGVLLIASMSQIQAAELRIAHCLYGCPKGSSSENHLILRPIYALSYNTRNKVADWAAYRVTSGSIGIASSLSRAVMIDDFVEETLSAADFINAEEAGFTLAQLVPLVNFAGTPYWNEVNYMSNAVARSQNLSLGAWYGLEWSIRNLVNREREVYVLTGPIFRDSPVVASLETQTQHRVPDAFFKIVVSADNRATAFIFDQDLPVHVHHCDTRAAIDEIETATGLEFFPENPRLVLGLLDTNLGCF